jgi:hypothetical protein
MISRQNLTEKFDRLQDDMLNVTAEISSRECDARSSLYFAVCSSSFLRQAA